MGKNFLKRLDDGKLMDRNQRSSDGQARLTVEAPPMLKKLARVL